MYAVVKINGSQYKIEENQILEVDRLEKKPAETFEISEVLLMVDGDKVQIGQPTVSGVKIVAKVLSQFKGEKIRVSRFKSKVRYRKVRGFRALLTKIQITQIGENQPKADPPRAEKKISKPKKKIIKKKE